MIWRGEIYQVDLGRPVGHEPAFLRPAIVVSSDIVNNGPGELVVVVPVTSTDYGLRSHIEIATGVSGLEHPSYVRCDQIRVVSTERIRLRPGDVAPDELRAIDRALRFILDL
ncbi:MAG: type II toxin-antitoxin system PemK/MazF family toxin [Acidimicrobiales bacterium]